MMKSGAEIYRVEDTITRICRALKSLTLKFSQPQQVYFFLFDEGSEDSDMHTFIKRIRGNKIDLTKISRINHFSREFTSTDLSVDEGLTIL